VIKALLHDREKLTFHLSVFAEAHTAPGHAPHDNLGAIITLRLQEDRVHRHGRLDPARFSLSGLGPSDLATVHCHGGVQRHVLRLKRRDPIAGTREDPAERGGKDTLPHTRGCPLNHQTRRLSGHWPNLMLIPVLNAKLTPRPACDTSAAASSAILLVSR